MRHSKEEIIAILDQLESKKAEDLESETLDSKQWIDRPKELYKMLVEYAVCKKRARPVGVCPLAWPTYGREHQRNPQRSYRSSIDYLSRLGLSSALPAAADMKKGRGTIRI